MEVHHHSSPASGGTHTPRKKWSHYFWEFLMLFLAVFCGFLAENQREHMVEHRREKGYMHSLIEDLQTDTSNLSQELRRGIAARTGLENLISFLNSESTKDSVAHLYELNTKSGKVVHIDFEDRTSSQLKNGGNMRLIRNKTVADSIRNYWGSIKIMDNVDTRLEEYRMKAIDIGAQIFHNKYTKYSDPRNITSDISILPGAKLISDDPALQAQYSNRRQLYLNVLNNYMRTMEFIKEEATTLIELIKKGYHFK